NEGYHGASAETAVRAELCSEAIRLTLLLLEFPPAASPETHALSALMCLHAARLPARADAAGDLNAMFDQERSQWDAQLIEQGLALLDRSAAGPAISGYHVEAAIAATHATASRVDETNWDQIVALYDRLMDIEPSPVVALNRDIAIGQRDGPDRGLEVLRAIGDADRLARYPFYPAAIGELEFRRGNLTEAERYFSLAVALAR